jgi:hypothetical protein
MNLKIPKMRLVKKCLHCHRPLDPKKGYHWQVPQDERSAPLTWGTYCGRRDCWKN